MVVKGRDQGIFTKGKRGGAAPDLILADFSTLILCALTTTAPSQIKSSVEELMSLRLVGIEIDLNDIAGWRGPFAPGEMPDELLDVLEGFSLEMRSMTNPKEASLAWALIMLFTTYTPNADLNSYDKIELIEQGAFRSAQLTLNEAGAGVSVDGYRREGPGHRAIRLIFDNGGRFDAGKLETRRTLYAPVLNEVAAMTKFMGASNADT